MLPSILLVDYSNIEILIYIAFLESPLQQILCIY